MSLMNREFALEIILLFGNYCIYSVFVLITCYWAHMLKKVDFSHISGQPATSGSTSSSKTGPMSMFVFAMMTIMFFDMLNIFFYLIGYYSLLTLRMFASAIIISVSIAILESINRFSSNIQIVLQTIRNINNKSHGTAVPSTPSANTQYHSERIRAITLVVNTFLACRLLLELISLAIFTWLHFDMPSKCSVVLCMCFHSLTHFSILIV